MKAAFDLKNLWLYGKGIGTFSLNLLHDLASTTDHPDVCIQLYSPSFDSPSLDFVKNNPRFQRISTRIVDKESRFDKVMYDQRTLPNSLRRHRADVLFSPYFDIPYYWSGTSIITLHDLFLFDQKELYGRVFRFYYKTLLQKALRQAPFVITVSDYTRKKIIETLNIPAERIKLIYNKVPEAFLQNIASTSKAVEQAIKTKYNLPSEFILYTGGLEARKNIALLVEGIASARKKYNGVPPLVITGVAASKIPAAYKALLSREKIIVLPFLTLAELSCLYNASVLVANTSSYEGFGIPVLEALTVQKPMLCSDIPPYTEVGGKNVYYFQSRNAASYEEQLLLFFRGKLPILSREQMAARAAFFNERNAAETFFHTVKQTL